MTLKRFEKMSQFMHVSNWELEIRNKNDPGYDPLYKVQPVIKAMDELFPKYCHMSPNCAIDESNYQMKAETSIHKLLSIQTSKVRDTSICACRLQKWLRSAV